MSIGGTVAGIQAAIKVGREAWRGFCEVVMWKRRQIVKAEVEHEKDLDGDGVIGGVGNTRYDRARMRRSQSGRNTDTQREILDSSRKTNRPDGNHKADQ